MKLKFMLPLLALACCPSLAMADCTAGVFSASDGDFVVLTASSRVPAPGMRYIFRDGRRGSTLDKESPVACEKNAVLVREGGKAARWMKTDFRLTRTTFASHGTKLTGELVEAPGKADPSRPLVVFVHGSERRAAIGTAYPYIFAAQGISVFVYDKRGTGQSEGLYTQNFELLADDAAAALVHARKLARGRFGRSGFFGGSQGGWVAPLAATRSAADFVAVGFGLVASPIDEDRDQMILEARAAGLGEKTIRQIERISRATARVVTSNFTDGLEALEKVRRDIAGKPWFTAINGEYSGEMIRMDDGDLRRVGRALFDNMELIWDYDSIAALRRLDVPLLWVLAGEDREAPIGKTLQALTALQAEGKPIDLYMFPDTDHGMIEFVANPDGSRTYTRITDGYFRLVGDWIRGSVGGKYGRAEKLTAGKTE